MNEFFTRHGCISRVKVSVFKFVTMYFVSFFSLFFVIIIIILQRKLRRPPSHMPEYDNVTDHNR